MLLITSTLSSSVVAICCCWAGRITALLSTMCVKLKERTAKHEATRHREPETKARTISGQRSSHRRLR